MMSGPLAALPRTNKILCCLCGISIAPNPSGTCATCLASTTDVSRGISTEAQLHRCRGCGKWHAGNGRWSKLDLESRELMSLCLANVSGLGGRAGAEAPRLVDAGWVWTEPHSMRLKIKLTVQRQVGGGSSGSTILQQSFIVEFVIRNQQCVDCQAEFRTGAWKSLVQVRQRVDHKRTFLYLEQLILKHNAHRGCLNIEAKRDGMDFYFPDKGKAATFISFLEGFAPIKIKASKKLIGMDDKSNVSNYKYTHLVEVCPLCREDLMYLPEKVARKMGNIGRCVLVKSISNIIHFVDPLTGQTGNMDSEQFWRHPLRPVVTAARSRLARSVVLGREAVVSAAPAPADAAATTARRRHAAAKRRGRLAEVTLAKEADLGKNDETVVAVSHVGYLLAAGDVCVGYDLRELHLADDDVEEARSAGKLPDVIVVRKLYGAAAGGDDGKKKLRHFKLKRLNVDITEQEAGATSRRKKPAAADAEDVDEEDFLREVEADKELRAGMNLYGATTGPAAAATAATASAADEADGDDEDDQKVRLDELLSDLLLADTKEAAAEGGSTMDDNGGPANFEGGKAVLDGLGFVGREDARNIPGKEVAMPVEGNSFGEKFTKGDYKFL